MPQPVFLAVEAWSRVLFLGARTVDLGAYMQVRFRAETRCRNRCLGVRSETRALFPSVVQTQCWWVGPRLAVDAEL